MKKSPLTKKKPHKLADREDEANGIYIKCAAAAGVPVQLKICKEMKKKKRSSTHQTASKAKTHKTEEESGALERDKQGDRKVINRKRQGER